MLMYQRIHLIANMALDIDVVLSFSSINTVNKVFLSLPGQFIKSYCFDKNKLSS